MFISSGLTLPLQNQKQSLDVSQLLVQVYGVQRHFRHLQYYDYIVAESFIVGGNSSTRRKPPTYRMSLTNSGVGPESLLTGRGLSYGAIFSIIDGTNCSPKAVLACRSVNLVFISFSVQQRKGTVIDFLKQSSGLSALTLSLIICLPHILGFLTSSGSHILALLSKHWWLNCSTFALQSSEL